MKDPAIYTPDSGEAKTIPELGQRIDMIARDIGGRKAMADILGVHYGTFSGWCRGEFEPKARHLRRIAQLGDCTVDWLLSDSRDAEQEGIWAGLRDVLSERLFEIHNLDPSEIGKKVLEWLDRERLYRQRQKEVATIEAQKAEGL